MVKYRRAILILLLLICTSQLFFISKKYVYTEKSVSSLNGSLDNESGQEQKPVFKYMRPSGKSVPLFFVDKVQEIMQETMPNNGDTTGSDVNNHGGLENIIVPVDIDRKNEQLKVIKIKKKRPRANSQPKYVVKKPDSIGEQNSNATGPKIVLYRFTGFLGTFNGLVNMNKCKFNDCTLKSIGKSDNTYIHGDVAIDADAVVVQGNVAPNYPLKRRNPDQVWVFFDMECPWYATSKKYGNEHWDSNFNWTMTYRRDSDIPNPYGIPIKRIQERPNRNYRVAFRKKTKSILWFVSHCGTNSKREDYAKQLRKYIDMDVYGGCTTRKPSCQFSVRRKCLPEEVKPYKFYLSFENTLCKDYVTEKFYTFLNLDVIPVVRGGANYSAIAPPGTYINTDDFKSPKDLAKYLIWLGNNEEEYTKYLKAKEEFASVDRAYQRSFCSLCEKLHNVDKNRKTYSSMREWWHDDSCRKPTDLQNVI